MKKLIIIILTICITIGTTSCAGEETAESHPYGVFNLPRATWGCTIDEFLEQQEKKKEDFKVEKVGKTEYFDYNYKRNIRFLGYDCEAIYSFVPLLNKKDYFLHDITLRIPLENNDFASIAKDVYETIVSLNLPYDNIDTEKVDPTDFTKNFPILTTQETYDLPEDLKKSADKAYVKMVKEMGIDKFPRYKDEVLDDSYSITTFASETLGRIGVSDKSNFNPDHAIVTISARGLAPAVAYSNYYK